MSLIGNLYTGCHVDGGLGFFSSEHPGNLSFFSGCYAETSTYNSFGTGTRSTTGAIFAGGFHVGPVTNQLQVGSPWITRCTTYFEPRGDFLRVQSSTSPGSLAFRRINVGELATTQGYLLWSYAPAFRNYPLVFADIDQSSFRPGTMWIPADFWLGDSQSLHAGVGVRIASALSGGGAVVSDPVAGPYDFLTSGSAATVGKYLVVTGAALGVNNGAFQITAFLSASSVQIPNKPADPTDPNMLDGCPTRHVIEPGHRAPEWQPSMLYQTYNFVCPTVDDHTGSYFQNLGAPGTSDGVNEPAWSSAPAPGDIIPIPDGGVTWTNAGAAAYTQPVELDGYIRHVISASETWEQTDRHFLCGSIEVFTAVGVPLGADATLKLPVGRYKRWIWNNTTGGFNLLVKCISGTGNTLTIGKGMAAEVQCSGIEILRRTADVTPNK